MCRVTALLYGVTFIMGCWWSLSPMWYVLHIIDDVVVHAISVGANVV